MATLEERYLASEPLLAHLGRVDALTFYIGVYQARRGAMIARQV